MDDETLLSVPSPRTPAGRVRLGLDRDVTEARRAGTALPGAGVALLRSLADQLDQLERSLRHTGSKAYDRVPLAQLARTFHDVYADTFATAGAGDPIGAALERFLAGEAANRDPGPAGIEQ